MTLLFLMAQIVIQVSNATAYLNLAGMQKVTFATLIATAGSM